MDSDLQQSGAQTDRQTDGTVAEGPSSKYTVFKPKYSNVNNPQPPLPLQRKKKKKKKVLWISVSSPPASVQTLIVAGVRPSFCNKAQIVQNVHECSEIQRWKVTEYIYSSPSVLNYIFEAVISAHFYFYSTFFYVFL